MLKFLALQYVDTRMVLLHYKGIECLSIMRMLPGRGTAGFVICALQSESESEMYSMSSQALKKALFI